MERLNHLINVYFISKRILCVNLFFIAGSSSVEQINLPAICRPPALNLGISAVQTEKTLGNYPKYMVGGQREGLLWSSEIQWGLK